MSVEPMPHLVAAWQALAVDDIYTTGYTVNCMAGCSRDRSLFAANK